MITTYNGVSSKLLDMLANRKATNLDDKAYQVARQEIEECSWCKSRKYKYEGHNFKECCKLKAHKQKKTDRKNAAQIAHSSATAESEHQIYDTAFAAQFQTSSSHPEWIFDTGASAHMT